MFFLRFLQRFPTHTRLYFWIVVFVSLSLSLCIWRHRVVKTYRAAWEATFFSPVNACLCQRRDDDDEEADITLVFSFQLFFLVFRFDFRCLAFPVVVETDSTAMASAVCCSCACGCFMKTLEICVTTVQAKPKAANGVHSNCETNTAAPAHDSPNKSSKCRIRGASKVTFIFSEIVCVYMRVCLFAVCPF